MKLFTHLLLILCLISASSCGVKMFGSPQRGGVEVGNGLSKYISNKYRFVFEYPTLYTLREHSPEHVELTHVGIQVDFEVMKDDTLPLDKRTSSGLAAYLEKQEPGTQFYPVKTQTAEGFYKQENGSDRLERIYFLVTNNGLFIKVTGDASPGEMSKIEKIVGTFGVDVTPPVLLDFVVRAPFTAGEEATFLVKVVDERSGVAPYVHFAIERIGPLADQEISNFLELRPISDDWYEAKWKLNAYLPSGSYQFTELSLQDRAGNLLNAGDSNVAWQKRSIEVVNHGISDSVTPKMKGLRVLPAKVTPGGQFKICVDAEVGPSGLKDTSIEFSLEGHSDISFSEFDLRNTRHLDEHGCMSLTLPRTVNAGTYNIRNYYLRNGIGIATYSEQDEVHATLVVETSETTDYQLPTVQEIRFSKGVYRAGDDVTMFVKVKAGPTGLRLEDHPSIMFRHMNGELSKFERLPRRYEAVGDNWYAVTMNLSKHIVSGRHYLSSLVIESGAFANKVLVWRRNPDGSFFSDKYWSNSQPYEVPLAYFDVSGEL